MFEKLIILSVNFFHSIFYQDRNTWKHDLIPTVISKSYSDRVVDLLIYKNHYALIQKLTVVLRNNIENFICRQLLNSYTSDDVKDAYNKM